MDNLGDWLYIVFLVIAAISGLFGSGKKKKQTKAKPVQPQQEEMPDVETERGKGFWEILQEMQNEPQEKPQEKPKPPVKSIPKPKPAAKKATPASPFLAGEGKISNFTPKQNTPSLLEEPIEEDHTVTSEDFHLQDIDEVRKAIIYNEILTRKY